MTERSSCSRPAPTTEGDAVNRLLRTTITAALCTTAAAAAMPSTGMAAPPTPAAPNRPVVAWNDFLLGLQATPGVQPATTHPTYELAVVHAALLDAAVAIDHSAAPYLTDVQGPRTASIPAAVDAAAHDTLAALYPTQRAAIDTEYAGQIAQVAPGARRRAGTRVGRRVAAQLLDRRADDGSQAQPVPFEPGSAPGDYQLTPPAFGPPAFTQWRAVRPFALRRADQFRPVAPP